MKVLKNETPISSRAFSGSIELVNSINFSGDAIKHCLKLSRSCCWSLLQIVITPSFDSAEIIQDDSQCSVYLSNTSVSLVTALVSTRPSSPSESLPNNSLSIFVWSSTIARAVSLGTSVGGGGVIVTPTTADTRS